MIKFFDMDGTLAKFYYHPQYLERMYEQGYFRGLKPYKLVDYVRECIEQGDIVCILSACIDSPYCKQEKIAWLHEYLPEIPDRNMIFTQAGENKAKAAAAWCDQYYPYNYATLVLIDDYGTNLRLWEQENKYGRHHLFTAIKYYNGINGTTKPHYKYGFKTIKQLRKICDKLC